MKISQSFKHPTDQIQIDNAVRILKQYQNTNNEKVKQELVDDYIANGGLKNSVPKQGNYNDLPYTEINNKAIDLLYEEYKKANQLASFRERQIAKGVILKKVKILHENGVGFEDLDHQKKFNELTKKFNPIKQKLTSLKNFQFTSGASMIRDEIESRFYKKSVARLKNQFQSLKGDREFNRGNWTTLNREHQFEIGKSYSQNLEGMSLKIDNQKFEILFDESTPSGVKISRINQSSQREEISDQDTKLRILTEATRISEYTSQISLLKKQFQSLKGDREFVGGDWTTLNREHQFEIGKSYSQNLEGMSLKIDNQKFEILFDESTPSGVKICGFNKNNQREEISDQDTKLRILTEATRISEYSSEISLLKKQFQSLKEKKIDTKTFGFEIYKYYTGDYSSSQPFIDAISVTSQQDKKEILFGTLGGVRVHNSVIDSLVLIQDRDQELKILKEVNKAMSQPCLILSLKNQFQNLKVFGEFNRGDWTTLNLEHQFEIGKSYSQNLEGMSLKIDNQKFEILFDESTPSGVKICRFNKNNQREEISDQDKIIEILEKANQVSTKISKQLEIPSPSPRPDGRLYPKPIEVESTMHKG